MMLDMLLFPVQGLNNHDQTSELLEPHRLQFLGLLMLIINENKSENAGVNGKLVIARV